MKPNPGERGEHGYAYFYCFSPRPPRSPGLVAAPIIHHISERQPQPELDLPWIGCGGRTAEVRVRRRARPERRVRQLEICAVEHVEAFGDHFQSHSLGEANAAAQSQVERSEIEAFARVAPYAGRPVVDVGIVVAIHAGHDVERQGRAVPEDRTQLKPGDDAPPQSAARLLGRG